MKKPMSVVQYINEKNKILEKYTGEVLVPKAQVMECEAKPLSLYDDMSACPYCAAYYGNMCKSCPMEIASNGCLASKESTYERLILRAEGHSLVVKSNPWSEELKELIHKFNESHGFKRQLWVKC